MANEVSIRLRGNHIGSIEFEPSKPIPAERTADGFLIVLPAILKWLPTNGDEPSAMLSNLQVTVCRRESDSKLLELGRATDDGIRLRSGDRSGESLRLEWRGSLHALAMYEKSREGRRAEFSLKVMVEMAPLVRSGKELIPLMCEKFVTTTDLNYSTDIWVNALRAIGVTETALLEIPVPATPPAPWDAVWNAFCEARDGLQQGGTTGAKACMTAVRLALDEWRAIEKEEFGPGWTEADRDDREKWSKRQRAELVRYSLRQLAHLAAHSAADQWTREDAMLGLAALSALLVVRRP